VHRAEPLGPVRFTIDFCAADAAHKLPSS
jgi:hypothetical protein